METSPESRFQSAQLTIIIVLLLALVGVAISQVYTTYQPQPQIKYEYRLGAEPDATIQETMNKLGAEGWELVFARRVTVGEVNIMTNPKPEMRYEMIFRRPVK